MSFINPVNSQITTTGGNTPRFLSDHFADIVNVKDYGAKGNGTTNDSVAVQACIDAVAAANGGIVYFPKGNYVLNIILKAGVLLTSYGPGYGYIAGSPAITNVTFTAAATGFIVDTPAGSTNTCGINGINFQGLGSGTAGGGVRFQLVHWGFVKNCHFNNFADQGILHVAGYACVFEDILAINCLLNRTRSSFNGAVEIDNGATDDYLSRIEATVSLTTTVSSSNLFCCAIALVGVNCSMSDVIGEISDIGIYVGGKLNRLSNVRADLNLGHGFYIDSSSNMLSSCLSLNNSQATTNTYDGFYMSTNGSSNVLAACVSTMSGGISNVIRYGYNDLQNTGVVAQRNIYSACLSAGYGTAWWNMNPFLGSSPIEAGTPVAPADATAIVDVSGTTFILLRNYATTTTITNFIGGFSGKTIRVQAFNANVTIANNATIVTNTAANKTLANGKVYRFTNWNGVWTEDA